MFAIRSSAVLTRKMSTSTYKNIIVSKQGPVTIIGINRPKKRNCVDSHTADELKKAIANFEKDDSSCAGVLYGVGGNFCAGYDLSELSSASGENAMNLYRSDGLMGPTIRFLTKPIIAAVSGYAVAGGFELSLMCDMRVMEENAIMGVYCRRFGVPLIDGGTVRLQAMVGLSRAMDYILTGRSIDAKEAQQAGLANRVVAVGTSLGQAINLASSLEKFPQRCMNVDRKSAYNAAFVESFDKLVAYERDNGYEVVAQESVPGAKKFMSGIGRHGKSYNLTDRDIPDWEAAENEQENKSKSKL